jgi:signal transduction histidine kinase
MVPEYNLKQSLKNKLSNDKISQIIGYVPLVAVIIYYFATKEWQHSNPVGFFIIIALVVTQQVFLLLPQTKDKEYVSSGGILPITIYNLALILGYIFYIPLYSPFILVIPPIIFVTVYYRGVSSLFFSSGVVITIVTLYTLKNGLPNEPYAKYYPYVVIILSITFASLVNRSGVIEKKLRTDLVTASDKVSEEREQLNTLINGINDSVVATDMNGNVIFYNTPSLKMFGDTTIKIGEPFSKHIRLFDDKSNLVDFFNIFSPDKNQQNISNLHLLDINNQKVNLAIDVSKVNSIYNQQEKQGVILLVRDITKQKSLDEQREEFTAVTSHELRTPIATAEANISLAMDKRFMRDLDPESRSRLEKAHQSVLYLADLINQLSELSNIENLNQQVVFEDVEVSKLFNELYNELVTSVTEKGLAFNTNIAENLYPVYTSNAYLMEILKNFLTNAIKYTQHGTITLKVENSKENDGGVIFSVSDTGDGIGSADKQKIFQKFYRAEDYKTMETRGTGLGLYLTLKLSRYINGKIWFSSELDKGSIFYIQIPAPSKKIVENESGQ